MGRRAGLPAGAAREGEPPLRLLFAGTPAPAVPSLEALLASRHEVVAVLTRPDARAGRGRGVSRSPVAERADAAGIPVLQPRSPEEPEFLEQLAELQWTAPRWSPTARWCRRRPSTCRVHGWVNLHFSLLPAWRGAAPVQHAIMAGDEVTGASTFRLEAGLDTGPVYGTVTEADRPAGHRRRPAGAARASAAPACSSPPLDGIEAGALTPEPQPAEGISLAPRIETQDARVDWALRAARGRPQGPRGHPRTRRLDDVARERLRLGPVEPAVPVTALAPGEVSAAPAGVLVGTHGGAVRLGEVQPAGKRMVPAADWARGARPEPGERMGT